MEHLIELLKKLVDSIPGEGSSVVVMLGILVEMALRLVKSDQPLSVALLVSKILHTLADGAEKLADLLDRVLPQRLKEKTGE